MDNTDRRNALSRRQFLAAGMGAASAGRLAQADPAGTGGPPAQRPNIVFLLVDQWRAAATGYAGDPNIHTPNLDRLKRESIDFRSTVSVCPICTPYRAALLTGRYPTTTGMFMNDLYLPAEETCLAEILKKAGYATGYIGKWHLDGHGRDAYIPPERRQGWDYWKAAECDHDYLHSHYYEGDSPRKRFWEGYDSFAQTLDAREYLRAHADDERPFILFVSYGTPHFPHFPLPPGYQDRHRPESLRLPPNVPPEMMERARKEGAGYYTHCEALDRCVGDIVTTLDQTGLAANTILVFSSDHGEMLGSHGVEPFTKQVPWSESALVPFLLRFPAAHGPRGKEVSTPFTTPDILPTLLGLAGVRKPRSVEGEDLSYLVHGKREPADRAALFMLVSPFGIDPQFAREYRAIRTRRHTYVRGVTGPWLLFDNEADPYQMRNLAAESAFASLRSRLDERLQAELRRIGDEFHPGAHYLRRWGYEVSKQGHIPYGPGCRVQSPKPVR